MKPTRPGVTACMIVRDSSRTLSAALKSIRPWVDDIVVVDTGSLDETPRIAAEFGARVFHFPWPDSFSIARNESLCHAETDWVFWFDSDDTIDAANGEKLQSLARRPLAESPMAYVMQVHCPADGAHGVREVAIVDHVKMFRNDERIRFEGRIHEQVIAAIRAIDGEIEWTDVHVVHSGSDQSPEGRRRKQQRDLRLLEMENAERPDHPFTLFNLGMTYDDMGESQKAVDALRASLRVAGPHESQVRKAYALLINSLTRLDQIGEAKKACDDALALYPFDVELLFRLGILEQRRENWQAATSAFQAALAAREDRYFGSIDPGLSGYKSRHNMAICFIALGRDDLAEIEWRRILSEMPNYLAAWQGLGESLLKQRKFATADHVARQLLEETPSKHAQALRVTGWRILARIAIERSQLDAAQKWIELAQQELPEELDFLELQCQVLFARERWDEAEESLLRLIALRPDDAAALHNLGALRSRAGKYSEAIDDYEASLALRPNHATTLAQLHAARRTGADANHQRENLVCRVT